MTVYVDDVRLPYRRMYMCHMWADTEEELHAMAHLIGIKRCWFQQPPVAKWKHYDICQAKKEQAIKLGAVLVDKYEALYQQATKDLQEKGITKTRREAKELLIKSIEEVRSKNGTT